MKQPRFRWNNKDSRAACICLIATRVKCKGKTFEIAIEETLPRFSQNPELIGQDQLTRIRAEAEALLTGKARRRGVRPAG